MPAGSGPGTYLLTVSAAGITSSNALFVDMGAGVNNVTLRETPDHLSLQVFQGSTLLSKYALGTFTSIVAAGDAGADTLTLDLSNGNFIPAGGLNYDGGGAGLLGTDNLFVTGDGTQTVSYAPSSTTTGSGTVTVGGKAVTFSTLGGVDFTKLGSVGVSPTGLNNSIGIGTGVDSLTGTNQALVFSGKTGAVPFTPAYAWNNGTVAFDTSPLDSNDTVTVTAAINGHGNTNLGILTGAGTDTVTFAGPAAVAGTVTVNTQLIVNAVPGVTTAINAPAVALTARNGGGSRSEE